jgi:hypothetical protein
MALFNSGRTDDEPVDDGDDEATDADTDASGGGRRRWLLVGLAVAVVAALYLRSKRRAAREARFTEIELDPVDSDSGAESEQSAE